LKGNELMAETRGLVQRVKLDPTFQDGYWVYVGPSPTNTTLFAVGIGDQNPQVLRRTTMAVLLTGALVSRREVIITHGASTFQIAGLEVVPG
jgi:hypothetical protein